MGKKEETVKCKTCGKERQWPHHGIPPPDNEYTMWFCSQECHDAYEPPKKPALKAAEIPKPKEEDSCEHFIIERTLGEGGKFKPKGKCLDCGKLFNLDPETGFIMPSL